MRTFRLTLAAAILGVAAVAFAAPTGAYVQPTGPTLAITLTVNPTSVVAGQPVTITATIINNTLLQQVTTGTITVVPPKATAATRPVTFKFPVNVAPQATQTTTKTFTVPLHAIKGTYTVTFMVPGAAAPIGATLAVT
jgi:hypothetical protein